MERLSCSEEVYDEVSSIGIVSIMLIGSGALVM